MAEKQVLVVHDDADFVARLRSMVESSGADVDLVHAISGPRAEGLLSQTSPDVIVVDAQLAGVDGYEFTRMVRSNPQTEQTPVIIVTLEANEVYALKARQVGASALLASNGQPEIIARKILQLAGFTADQPLPSPMALPHADVSEPAQAPQPIRAAPTPAPQPPTGAEPASETAYGAPQPVGAQTMASRDAMGQLRSSAPSSAPMPSANEMPHLDDLLRTMLERGGSDLHIAVGSPPGIRQRGELLPLEDVRPLSARDSMEMILNILSEEQRRRFETELELDFAYSIPGVSRFRANVFQQRNSMGAVFRVIPIEIPTLEQLGLPKVCTFLAERPRGLVLVTGPTGSGKSTTLYSCLKTVMNPEENVNTVEDPVEYELEGINQCHVNPKRGLTFANALRALLRQDPDTVMIGEIRDQETIEIAVKAALTGHLVLSTLHTNDAPSTITRIIDMGIEPLMVASTLNVVLAQRLGRRLCSNCKVDAPREDYPDRPQLLHMGFKPEDVEGLKLKKAVGCSLCSNGYKGRFALVECLEMNDRIRKIIIGGGTDLEIRKVALETGMISLRRAGLLNVMRGVTTLEEVLRNTVGDESEPLPKKGQKAEAEEPEEAPAEAK